MTPAKRLMTRAEIAKSFDFPIFEIDGPMSAGREIEPVAVLPTGGCLYDFDDFFDLARDFARGYTAVHDSARAIED